ncbi:MAG: hypothetical protein ACK454_05695, partial [Flavobacteriales bacterium]
HPLILSPERSAQGFGRFPYVIVRVQPTLYLQFPIHFYHGVNPELPGLRVRVDDSTELDACMATLFSVMQGFYAQVNGNEAVPYRMCLVLRSNLAYFWEKEGIMLSREIPEGGALMDGQYKVLSLNSSHYIRE